jgi:hypothetical protein
MTDFSRLSESWLEWSNRAGLSNPDVTMKCDDCEIAFRSSDYSIHLRHEGNWWVVDTIDDRGQRNDDTAKLSTFELVEKYLIWDWASMTRGIIGARRLGPGLYAQGFSSEVEVAPISEGISELRSQSGNAILMEPYATIFSHLMSKSVDEIQQLTTADLG